jgi:SAM-dependent methyltransferase
MRKIQAMLSNQRLQYFGKDLEAMAFAKNYHKWILSRFSPYLGNSVAEVGAGIGNFSTLILGTGIHSLVAFEPSLNMYPLLQAALAKDTRARTVNDFLGRTTAEPCFDSILYVNVLEHIDDEVSEFAKARESLNPGGHLLMFVPAIPWLYSDLDRQVGHYRRYLKNDFIGITRRAGFSVVDARYFDIAGIIPWYINCVLLRNSLSGGGVSLYDRLVVPITRTMESLVPAPIGKNLLLIAKKT